MISEQKIKEKFYPFLHIILVIVYLICGYIIGYNQGYQSGQKDYILFLENSINTQN